MTFHAMIHLADELLERSVRIKLPYLHKAVVKICYHARQFVPHVFAQGCIRRVIRNNGLKNVRFRLESRRWGSIRYFTQLCFSPAKNIWHHYITATAVRKHLCQNVDDHDILVDAYDIYKFDYCIYCGLPSSIIYV